MATEFRWNKPISQIAKEATGGRRTLLFMANEARRLMSPYVPVRNPTLDKNVRTYVEDGSGVVHYLSPYARYQYHSLLMVSRITGSSWAKEGESKVLTGIPLDHSGGKHLLATAEWDKAMMTAKGGAYTQAVQNYIRRKG